MKKQLILLSTFIFSNLLYSTTYKAVQDGPWDDPATWDLNAVPCICGNPNGTTDDIVVIKHHKVEIRKVGGVASNYVCKKVTLKTDSNNTTDETELKVKGNSTLRITGGSNDLDDDEFIGGGDNNGASLFIKNDNNCAIIPRLIISNGEVSVDKSDVTNYGTIKVQNLGKLFIDSGDLNIAGDHGKVVNNNLTCENFKVGDDVHMSNNGKITTNETAIVPIILGSNDVDNLFSGFNINTEDEWLTSVGTYGDSFNFSYPNQNYTLASQVIGVENFFHTVAECYTALPVELTKFEATKINSNDPSVIVAWETASETNNAGYEVHHSTDGVSWNEIAFVNPLPGSDTDRRVYSYIHNNPVLNATNYYQLKQIDIDGEFSFSPVDAVEIVDPKRDVSLATAYPNPISSLHSQITVDGLYDGDEYEIYIIDTQGNTIQNHTVEGGTKFQIKTTDMVSGGMYFINVYNVKLKEMKSLPIVKVID
ncbi:T9SS type A sorting domain-containing protein [Bacteriovoracaceae bacterium]|nr:T9SS type A sorting domain-containing protein [Bacteriovoracaceae bacterium]